MLVYNEKIKGKLQFQWCVNELISPPQFHFVKETDFGSETVRFETFKTEVRIISIIDKHPHRKYTKGTQKWRFVHEKVFEIHIQ